MGIPDRFDEHVKLMFDLQCLAFQADVTRVFTFMLGRETSSRSFPRSACRRRTTGNRTTATSRKRSRSTPRSIPITREQFASFLKKLRSTPDGDGTLLDRLLLLYGAGLSNGNEHSHLDLPLLLVGRAGIS